MDSTTDFTLSKTPPDAIEIYLVTLDGVVQYPSDTSTTRSYNVSLQIQLSFTNCTSQPVF